jgi:hypothetical protein
MSDLYRCPTCGASLSLEQLRGTDCPFCKTVFPHHGRANEQAALVNQIMAQQMAQQNPYGYGAPPPQIPNAYGAPPPQNPYAQQNMYAQQWQGAVQKSMRVTIITIVAVGLGFVLVGAVVAVLLIAG